jgi:hypothetical protein
VRHVQEHRGGIPGIRNRFADLIGHVDQVRSPLRGDPELAHGRVSYEIVPASLDEYRDEADRFLAALMEEYYLHFAGLKDRLELGPVYDRHADLVSLESCRWLAREAEGAKPGSAIVELWRFGCEGYLGAIARSEEERIAELEATMTAEVGGEEIGYRMLRPRLANEPERDRREAIDRARLELVEQLNAVHAEALARLRDGVRDLGAATTRELYEGFGFPLAALADQCSRFLTDTEDLYVAALDRLLRSRIGLGLGDVRRWDMPRALRAPRWDDGFPADRMLPALEQTLAAMGIDLRAQRNVELDVDERPTKSPRAFCAPVEVPGRIVLVIQPQGGVEDWRALFHEAGHTEHFAHTSSGLSLEARRLGDNAVSEGWAFLLEHLVTDPAWLSRRLDVGRPDELASETAAVRLFYLRRYCAKLLYELELHSGAEAEGMRERYAELLLDATKIDYAESDFLADVDPGFYCTSYLRAWALEARVAGFLREHHGRAWFAERKAGSLVRELWSEGQGMDADRLSAELTGAPLELDDAAEEIASLV